MSRLFFSSIKEAIQYLSDYSNKRIIIAAVATIKEVKKFQSDLSKELGLKSLSMYVSGSDLSLNSIIVEKISQRQGIGTKAMEAITDFADQHSMRITLTTGLKDKNHGTTSGSRLKKFYKRFEFVENKGRNKDFAISANMYRDPKRIVTAEDLSGRNEFFKKHNINEERMSYLGKGDFGEAYSIGNNKVLKITSSKREFDLAKELIGKSSSFSGFAEFFAAEEVGNEYMIIVELLDTASEIEDYFTKLLSILEEQGVPIQYMHQYLDTDELDLDKDMMKFINDMDDVSRSYHNLGIEAGDIRDENLGYDKNNKIKAFDIFDKSH